MKINIVGTSPILLLLACKLSTHDNQITLYEQESSIGGCWRSTSIYGKYYDTACHLIIPSLTTFAYLIRFGATIYRLNPQPQISLDGVRYTLSSPLDRFILKYRTLSGHTLKRLIFSSIYILKEIPSFVLGYWYVSGGSHGMLMALTRYITNNGGTIHYNRTAESVFADHHHARLTFTDKSASESDLLIYSDSFSCQLTPQRHLSRYLVKSLIISIPLTLAKPFTYIKIIDSRYLKRISLLDSSVSHTLIIAESDISSEDLLPSSNDLLKDLCIFLNISPSEAVINQEFIHQASSLTCKVSQSPPISSHTRIRHIRSKTISRPHLQRALRAIRSC